MASSHHGKTYTEVNGRTRHEIAEGKRMSRLRKKQYDDFGKVNWEYFEHAQMWDMVQSAKPQHMYEKAEQWSALAESIQGTTSHVQGVVQNLLTTWRGSAAVSAGQSQSKLTEWAGQAGNTAVGIGSGLSKYADAVSHAQATMPEPVNYVAEHRFADGYAIKVDDPNQDSYLLKHLADDHMPTREEAKTAKAKAVKVMEGYEDHSQTVHKALPEFQQAPSMAPHDTPVSGPAAGPGGPGGGSQPPYFGGSGGPGGTGVTPAPGAGSGTDPSSGTSAQGWTPPSIPGGGNGYPGSSGYPGSTGYPGTGVPGSGGLPGTGGTSGFNGANGFGGVGGVPGGGGLRGASGGLAGSGEGPAGGARSGAGALGSAASAEEAAAARGAAGRAGAGGSMYPPMGGGGAGNGEGDGEHHNKYDEGLDLFDDIPPAYPSVFGA